MHDPNKLNMKPAEDKDNASILNTFDFGYIEENDPSLRMRVTQLAAIRLSTTGTCLLNSECKTAQVSSYIDAQEAGALEAIRVKILILVTP
jgi:hypothetical protein